MSTKVNVTIPNLSNLNPQVKLEGEWSRLDRLSSNMVVAVESGYQQGIKVFSQKLLRIVRRALISGTPPPGGGTIWAPHAEATILRYGTHPIYNLTGLYASSVGLFQYKSKTYVGLQQNKKRASQGSLTLNQLAKILEFGNDHIPARPVWAPSLVAAGGKTVIKDILLKSIRSKLLSTCGVNARRVK